MSAWDDMDRRFGRKPEPIELEPAEEGDACPDPKCGGHFAWSEVENCSCHISPPCRACVDAPLLCSECGEEAP